MTKKVKTCPQCESSRLGDSWTNNRKLRQTCECGWVGPIRTPEKQTIETTKTVNVGHFSGFEYEIFDKYGHIMTSSRTYSLKVEAEVAMLKELSRGKADKDAGPYTGLIWPDSVVVRAEIYT